MSAQQQKREGYERDNVSVNITVDGRELSAASVTLLAVSVEGLEVQTSAPLREGEELQVRLEMPSGTVATSAELVKSQGTRFGFRSVLRFKKLPWAEARKIKMFLKPGGIDFLKLADKLLVLAALVIAAGVGYNLFLRYAPKKEPPKPRPESRLLRDYKKQVKDARDFIKELEAREAESKKKSRPRKKRRRRRAD